VKLTAPEVQSSVCPFPSENVNSICHTPEKDPRGRLNRPVILSVPPVSDVPDPPEEDGGTLYDALTAPPGRIGTFRHPSGMDVVTPDVQVRSIPMRIIAIRFPFPEIFATTGQFCEVKPPIVCPSAGLADAAGRAIADGAPARAAATTNTRTVSMR
jgi:hypothetical protein